jgi:hypothetical protein
MRAVSPSAQSRIRSVELFARGARVMREVTLPPLEGTLEVEVPGVTAFAEPGSLRAEPQGGVEVVALRSRLEIPAERAASGEPLEKVRALEGDRERVHGELEALRQRHAQLRAVSPKVTLVDPKSARVIDPHERTRDALAVCELARELAADLEKRIAALTADQERISLALEAAQVAASQAPSEVLEGAGRATRTVLVSLRVIPGGAAPSLSLSYAVRAARWWPAYAARFSDGGTRATLALDAFVAQDSGEDWNGVKLALSTADLISDARLPELPSLRLGRAQPPARKGYREPPPDLDALFEGWDQVATSVAPPPPPPRPSKPKPAKAAPKRTEERARATTIVTKTEAYDEEEVTGQDYGEMPQAEASAPPQNFGRAMQSLPVGGMAPGAAPMTPMPMRRAMAASVPADEVSAIMLGEAAPSEPQAIAALEPADAWLDFDSLSLGGIDDRVHRGKLVYGADSPDGLYQSIARIEGCPAPQHAVDPLHARGRFDHRYAAAGALDVPSDGRAHRLPISRADAKPTLRLRTLPREVPEVFREATLPNPFDAPLLGGPVDVFFDDALMTTSALAPVDRGGTCVLGLGVEDRVRVARNARAEESSAGLLGGSTVIDHTVTIDLKSALGRATQVEVIDRLPVSDLPQVEVIPGDATPSRGEPYDQRERHQPIRGGLVWRVDVPAGGARQIQYRYRIKLPAKNELVGGNRRE